MQFFLERWAFSPKSVSGKQLTSDFDNKNARLRPSQGGKMKIEGADIFGFQISMYEDMDSDRDRYPRKILKGDRYGLE